MNDLKFAARQSIKPPGGTIVILVTLSLVLGGLTTVGIRCSWFGVGSLDVSTYGGCLPAVVLHRIARHMVSSREGITDQSDPGAENGMRAIMDFDLRFQIEETPCVCLEFGRSSRHVRVCVVAELRNRREHAAATEPRTVESIFQPSSKRGAPRVASA